MNREREREWKGGREKRDVVKLVEAGYSLSIAQFELK